MNRFLALALILLFALAAIIVMVSNPPPNPEAARSAERLKVLRDLKAEDQARLNTYAPSDRVKGGFQIPIDRAMELTIPELNARPPAPAAPQETSLP